jgi:phosphotransacetylase
MKGGVHTSTFSKALLDKRAGLLPPGGLMGHLGMFELPFYHKPLFITDSAINIEPDLEKKIQLARNACRVMRSLGIDNQKVALLAPVEKVNHRIQSTLDAAAFTVRQQEAGVCPFAEVDGPYAMDVIISRQAAEIKGITSDVAGDADLIICPNLDTANAVYKILTFVHGSRSAGIIAGLTVPVVLTSRSDHEENRFNSLGMALSSAHAPD